MIQRNYRILFCMNLIVIVVASLVPSSVHSSWNLDKVGHFAAYGSLFMLALFSFQVTLTRIVAFLLSVILGITMEWLQSYVPGRDPSAIDALANFAGLVFGIFVYRFLRTRFGDQH